MLLLAAYLLVPDHLGGGAVGLPNGGFLKARLALLPPLFWLACLREPNSGILKLALRAGIVAMLGVNLWLVNEAFRDGNRELARYTAGIEAVGRGHRIVVNGRPPQRSVFANPLTHMADYYSLGTSNVNLDNYEGMMPHFPVRYRPGFSHGHWNLASPDSEADVLMTWQSGDSGPPGWDEVFRQGALRIHRRPR
jgi:hypothetical protein